MSWKSYIAKAFRSVGYDLSYYHPDRHPAARRIQLLRHQGIDLVLDVGANRGQFGQELRTLGYKGKIVSFEPLSEAFAELKKKSELDGKWDAINCALGDREEVKNINISGNSESSSLLPILDAHVAAAPASAYVNEEEISVVTLDSIFDSFCSNDVSNVLLKIDTQGYEKLVLLGAEESIGRINLIQVEVSLVPLYSGAPDMHDIIKYMCERRYSVFGMEPVFTDEKTGRLLQADLVFGKQ